MEIGELDRIGNVLALDRAERSVLNRAGGRLGVEWRLDGGARVYSSGWVGLLRLSDRTSIRVTTKVPLANILTLASLAYRILRIPPAFGSADLLTHDSITDWFAVLITTEVRALLRNRLRQDYVVVEDALPYVRGRILFEGTSSWSRPGMTSCEFADFLPDIPENRIIRSTLEVLATHRLLPGLEIEVKQLLRSFHMVSYMQPSRQLLASYSMTRLTHHYEPALQLCRLFLEQSGVELEPGKTRAPAFFFPMEYVFQEGITALLRERLGAKRQPGGSHQPLAGGPARNIVFAGDISIGSPPQLVLDTKYVNAEVKNQFGGLSFRNDHIYQIAFYALSFGCPAVLVYPKVDRDIDVHFDVEGVRIGILSVDLQQEGLPGLDDLVQRVSELKDHVRPRNLITSS